MNAIIPRVRCRDSKRLACHEGTIAQCTSASPKRPSEALIRTSHKFARLYRSFRVGLGTEDGSVGDCLERGISVLESRLATQPRILLNVSERSFAHFTLAICDGWELAMCKDVSNVLESIAANLETIIH